jgi:PhnB protein
LFHPMMPDWCQSVIQLISNTLDVKLFWKKFQYRKAIPKGGEGEALWREALSGESLSFINLRFMSAITYSITPWLSVSNGNAAIEFYQKAFEAFEIYHLDAPDGGVVSRLSIKGAEFWISDGAAVSHSTDPAMRIILTVPDPDEVFEKAISAGGIVVYPVGEGHGWRIGRLSDPFGHHWEIGKQL